MWVALIIVIFLFFCTSILNNLINIYKFLFEKDDKKENKTKKKYKLEE